MSKARVPQSNQKLEILTSCSSRATVVLDLHDDEESGAGRLAKRGLSAFGIGRLSSSSMQIYLFKTAAGGTHFYVQPFDGRLPLPGEHHVWLPAPLPDRAVFQEGILKNGWRADGSLKKTLNAHPVTHALRQADFTWKLGAGEVKRDWFAQMRPVRGGTHLMMKGTGEGDVSMDTRPVGFKPFIQAIEALMTTPLGASGPDAAFAEPSTSADLFEQMIIEPPAPAPRKNTAGRDFGAPLHQLLSPHAGKRFYVHPLPAKPLGNIRKHIMPNEAAQLPVIAATDFTMMGSCKEGFVFTPTHGFLRQSGRAIHFEWSEVIGASLVDDDIARVHLAERGLIHIERGKHATAIVNALSNFASLPDLS